MVREIQDHGTRSLIVTNLQGRITFVSEPVTGNKHDMAKLKGSDAEKILKTGTLAKEFIEHAIAANGGTAPAAVHADHGTSMTLNTVAGLYAKLNIAQSHSRPHVSDDNPYSEAQFKTLKYCPAFPGEFGSIQDANVFCEAFFTYYNTGHRHSGIAMHTPASVHDGT